MNESNNFRLLNNNFGSEFYEKWKKDTILSAFIVAPSFFIFYLICTILIFGVSLKLFLILIFPVVLIVVGLIYSPYFLRRKYVNNTVKNISVKGDIIAIETYNWFSYRSISISSEIINIEIKESANELFFKGEKVFLLTFRNLDKSNFYIVNNFFDNIEELLNIL